MKFVSVDKIQVRLVMKAKNYVSSLYYSFGHFPPHKTWLNF